jgi:hypothetical protein
MYASKLDQAKRGTDKILTTSTCGAIVLGKGMTIRKERMVKNNS